MHVCVDSTSTTSPECACHSWVQVLTQALCKRCGSCACAVEEHCSHRSRTTASANQVCTAAGHHALRTECSPGPGVKPHNCMATWLPSAAAPHKRCLALIGNAHCCNARLFLFLRFELLQHAQSLLHYQTTPASCESLHARIMAVGFTYHATRCQVQACTKCSTRMCEHLITVHARLEVRTARAPEIESWTVLNNTAGSCSHHLRCSMC